MLSKWFTVSSPSSDRYSRVFASSNLSKCFFVNLCGLVLRLEVDWWLPLVGCSFFFYLGGCGGRIFALTPPVTFFDILLSTSIMLNLYNRRQVSENHWLTYLRSLINVNLWLTIQCQSQNGWSLLALGAFAFNQPASAAAIAAIGELSFHSPVRY